MIINEKDKIKIEIAAGARIDDSVRIEGLGELKIEEFAVLEPNVILRLGMSSKGKITIGIRAKIKAGVILNAYNGMIDIGQRTSIGEYSVLSGHGGLIIGHAVIVSSHCNIFTSNHIIVSEIPIRFQGETAKGIHIKDGVWIGANCCILDGVVIGRGAVIGAGTTVDVNVAENHVCIGQRLRKMLNREVTIKDGG